MYNVAKKKKWKICIYGLGIYYKTAAVNFLNILNISPDYYTDRNVRVLEELNVDVNKKKTVEKINDMDEDILLLLFVSTRYDSEIINTYKDKSNIHIITWQGIHEILDHDNIIKEYLGINYFTEYNKDNNRIKRSDYFEKYKGERIAVYVCITDGYDIPTLEHFKSPQMDFYLITDGDVDSKINDFYTVLDVNNIVPSRDMSPKDKNRYCKMHAKEIFPDYAYSMYIDGSFIVLEKAINLVNKIGKYGIAVHKHAFSDDVYLEGLSQSARGRVTKEDTKTTLKYFARKGLPRHYGEAECGIIIRNHNNDLSQIIMDRWYKYYMNFPAKRDQFTFVYTLWELGIQMDEVCTLPGNERTNGFFQLTDKKHKIYKQGDKDQ